MNDSVFITPWTNCGSGFENINDLEYELFRPNKLKWESDENGESGQFLPKYYRTGIAAVRDEYVVGIQRDRIALLHPAAQDCYLSAKGTETTGASNVNVKGSEPQSQASFSRSRKPRGFDETEKLMALTTHWKTTYDSTSLNLTNKWDLLPEGEFTLPNANEQFKEHVELYFLSREMFIKGSWLSSVSIRLVELLNAEEIRISFATEYNQQSKAFTLANITSIQSSSIIRYERNADNRGNETTTVIEPTVPPTLRTGQKIPSRKYMYKSSTGRIQIETPGIHFDEQQVELFESLQNHLGLIHPPPVIGEKAYFLPPSTFHVSDRKVEPISLPLQGNPNAKSRDELKDRVDGRLLVNTYRKID